MLSREDPRRQLEKDRNGNVNWWKWRNIAQKRSDNTRIKWYNRGALDWCINGTSWWRVEIITSSGRKQREATKRKECQIDEWFSRVSVNATRTESSVSFLERSALGHYAGTSSESTLTERARTELSNFLNGSFILFKRRPFCNSSV